MSEKVDLIINVKVAGLDTVVQMATAAARQITQAFLTIHAAMEQGANLTKDTLLGVIAQVSAASAEMSNKYKGMSLDELSSEFVKLEESIRRQTAVLEEAQTKLEAYKASLGAGEEVNDAQYIALADSVNAARSSLSALKAEQGQVAVAKVNATSESNSNDDSKKKAESSKATLTAITSLMTTVGKATGGVTEQILSIGAQVLNLIPAFQAAGQAGAVMGSTLNTALGVVGIIFTVIMAVVNAIAQAEAEAKKKLEDNRKEIDSLRENNTGAGSLVSEYDMLSQKVIKTAEDMQRMNNIRAELVETYGFSVGAIDEEGRLLAGNLDTMKEQLALSEQLMLSKMRENEAAEKNTVNNSVNKIKGFENDQDYWKSRIEDPTIVFGDQYKDAAPDSQAMEDMQYTISVWQENLDKAMAGIEDAKAEGQVALDNLFNQMVLKIRNRGQDVPIALQQVMKLKMDEAFNGESTAEEAAAAAQKVFDAYTNLDSVVSKADLPTGEAIREQLLSMFAAGEGSGLGEIDMLSGIVDSLNSSGAQMNTSLQLILQDAITTIDSNTTSIADKKAQINELFSGFDLSGFAISDVFGNLEEAAAAADEGGAGALLNYEAALEAAINSVDGMNAASESLKKVLKTNLNNALDETREKIEVVGKSSKRETQNIKKADAVFEDLASGGKNATKAIGDISKSMGDLGKSKSALSIVEQGADASDQYTEALNYLAEQFGVSASDIESNSGLIADAISDEEDYYSSLLQTLGQFVGVEFTGDASSMVAQLQNLRAGADDVTKSAIDAMIAMYSIPSANVSSDGKVTFNNKSPFGSKLTGGGGGGGGGAKKNKALEREKELLEHNKAMGQVTTAEEIANLERILAKYAKTTDEKRELTEKLYELRKQLAEEELEYQKAMDQLTLREEIAAMDKMIASYKEGTTARRDLEKERYEAARELERQEYDLKVYYGQMTLAEQEAQLKKMIASYKEGVQDRIDLEKELYDLQQTIRQQNIDRLNGLSDAIVSALQERYEAQREMEEKTLNDSIDAWQTWGDEQVAAIQRQIDALDELTKQESDAEEEAKKRRKIAMLEQQLLYEQDVYNRRKLQEEIVKSQKELDDWLVQKERDALKADLQKQIDAVNETVKTEQEKLQDKIDANNAYYEELEKEQNLRAEAQKMLMQSGQTDIINLLKEFAPEYNATGQTLGDQLVDGFMSRVGDIEAWFASLTSSLTTYQQELAHVATTAAEQYYSVHGYPTAQESPAPTGPVTNVGPTLNLYFTETTQSPAEIRRELERLLEQISQM